MPNKDQTIVYGPASRKTRCTLAWFLFVYKSRIVQYKLYYNYITTITRAHHHFVMIGSRLLKYFCHISVLLYRDYSQPMLVNQGFPYLYMYTEMLGERDPREIPNFARLLRLATRSMPMCACKLERRIIHSLYRISSYHQRTHILELSITNILIHLTVPPRFKETEEPCDINFVKLCNRVCVFHWAS